MYNDARSAYLNSSVTTASPARLLVMLCDRLVLDVQRALDAQQAHDHHTAHTNFLHAQDIVAELDSSLRPDLWDGAAGLQSLYRHLHGQLVKANVDRDSVTAQHCLGLVGEIRDTWREAALAAAAAAS